jgi:hypothetical protein
MHRSTTSSALQELFFPEGIAFDGNRFNRTVATAPLFNYLAPSDSVDEEMVSWGESCPKAECLMTPGLKQFSRRENW